MKKVVATILLWTSGMLAVALGFGLAIYAHENWPALEAPGAITFFVFGMMFGVLTLRTRAPLIERRAGWTSIVCIGFSISFAIVHGWEEAVRIVYFVAALAFFVGVVWFVRRTVRRLYAGMGSSTVSDVGEPSEQAILADAAEPYILYPAKRKIARPFIGSLIITALLAIATVWIFTNFHDTNALVPGGLLLIFAALCGLFSLALGYRLFAHKPTLILTQLGLIDRGSSIFDGAGPIWWDEVASVGTYHSPQRFLRPAYGYLVIMPVDMWSVKRRQPLFGRFLMRLFTLLPFAGMAIQLAQFMLPISLEEVMGQIERFGPPVEETGDKENFSLADDTLDSK